MNSRLQIVALQSAKDAELKKLENQIGIKISSDDVNDAITESK